MSSMPLVFGSNLTCDLSDFFFFAFFFNFPLGVIFRVRLGVSIILWLMLWFTILGVNVRVSGLR